jgi:hypothetical protein
MYFHLRTIPYTTTETPDISDLVDCDQTLEKTTRRHHVLRRRHGPTPYFGMIALSCLETAQRLHRQFMRKPQARQHFQ